MYTNTASVWLSRLDTTTKSGSAGEITECGPVDRTAQSLSLYQAELQGQLAIRICSTLLVQQYSLQGGILTSMCDNQGVLRREERVAHDIKLGTHKEAEADLLLTMRD